jgi:hypothetical protein
MAQGPAQPKVSGTVSVLPVTGQALVVSETAATEIITELRKIRLALEILIGQEISDNDV